MGRKTEKKTCKMITKNIKKEPYSILCMHYILPTPIFLIPFAHRYPPALFIHGYPWVTHPWPTSI